MAQMIVEHHGDVADQETSLRRNGQAVRFEADQAEGFQLLHVLQFDREITVKRNAEHAFVNPIVEREAAHQILNDVAAQNVVLIELVAAHDGQVSGVECGVIGIDVALVLGVGAADFADRGHADRYQVAVGIGGITLEISLQETFFEGDGELVVRFGKVVHADENIATLSQGLDAILQHIEFFFAAGNDIGVDTALRFEDMRQVGVVVEGKAVGVEGQDRVDGGFDAFGVLVRQAVNQIDADGFEPCFAGGIDDFFGFFVTLDTVDGCLHFRIEVLNTDAHAVEAEFAQFEDGFAADFARVDFDGVFAVGNQLEVFADHVEDAFELVVAQEGRRAAAEVELRELVSPAQMRCQQFHFFFQILDIGIGTAFVFGNDFVTAAVVADGIAEGNVDVERKGFVERAHVAQV